MRVDRDCEVVNKFRAITMARLTKRLMYTIFLHVHFGNCWYSYYGTRIQEKNVLLKSVLDVYLRDLCHALSLTLTRQQQELPLTSLQTC